MTPTRKCSAHLDLKCDEPDLLLYHRKTLSVSSETVRMFQECSRDLKFLGHRLKITVTTARSTTSRLLLLRARCCLLPPCCGQRRSTAFLCCWFGSTFLCCWFGCRAVWHSA
jgi:hypothetical protein